MKHGCVNVFCTNCAAMVVAKVSIASLFEVVMQRIGFVYLLEAFTICFFPQLSFNVANGPPLSSTVLYYVLWFSIALCCLLLSSTCCCVISGSIK
jgi:hypothetical protein